MLQKKVCTENKTRILYSKKSFFNSAFHEKMWKITVETSSPQTTKSHRKMAKNSHSERVKYILFPQQ
jgi:hypothetical protein